MTTLLRDEDLHEIRFGGGRNTRASPDQINPRECTDGENFILDPGNDEFRRRKPFDLVATAPNGSEIRGFVTLKRTDGAVSMLVQAGDTVYEWDGSSFSVKGTVSATAKLRGTINSFWALEDKVIISDLNLQENVSTWDGTTFAEASLFQKDGSTVFTNFKAKYCVVNKERALFGNISDNGTSLPHLLVGTQRGDLSTLINTGASDSDRPSSSLSEEDPWFIPTPQLKPINGLAYAYGILAISQLDGAFEKLEGDTAKDFKMTQLHDGSGAAGDEAVVSTFNDIIYGAPGHIESLKSTDEFGDVELDDLSFYIRDDITAYSDWTLVYNRRLRRIYCFPSDAQEVHVLFTDFIGQDISGWSKFTTNNSFSFQPTSVMNCFDPADNLEYVFMGDASGNIYRLEGNGIIGDAGSTDIEAKRTTRLIAAPADAKAFNIEGWLKHRKLQANTARMVFKYAGEHAHDQSREVTFASVEFTPLYNSSAYYGGEFYYGIAQENRLIRKTWEAPGLANEFEVEISVEGQNDFAINQIGIRFDYSN